MSTNIFTVMIADMLDVSTAVATRVQNQIDNFYNLDWSEADEEEIRFYAHMAFEDLNEEVEASF
mgnify:FL=1|jgi:hypothetical protein